MEEEDKGAMPLKMATSLAPTRATCLGVEPSCIILAVLSLVGPTKDRD